MMTRLLFFVSAALTVSIFANAQDLASGLTPPKFQKATIGYTGLFHNEATFPTGDAATSFQAFDVSVPFFKTDTEAWTTSLSGNQLAVVPTQGEISKFYDLKMGLGYSKALDENRQWSANLRFGSASDKLFANPSVTTIGATWFYSYPADETARWMFLVDYSNNRPILNNIPLPGFAYFYTPSKTFRLAVGAPFASVNWEFADRWGLDGFTLVPWVIKSSVYYKVNDFAKAYAGIDFSQITYYLADRENNKERVFYDEKKMFVGFKTPLSKNLMVDLEIGHAFDRAFFQSEEYEIDPENPTSINNAFYGKISIRLFNL